MAQVRSKPVVSCQLSVVSERTTPSAPSTVNCQLSTGPRTLALGRRVLVVDDDPLQLKLLRIHLEHMGFEVATATGGAEALDQLQRMAPDAIVSDVLMPGLNGFQLCHSIRQDPA